MMQDTKQSNTFKLVFHLFIFICAIGFIITSIVAWNELDRALLYLLLGLIFTIESVVGLYKNIQRKKTAE